MSKLNVVASTLFVSLLALGAAACSAPASSESGEPTESSASAIDHISPCIVTSLYCNDEPGPLRGHTVSMSVCDFEAGGGFLPGACPALGAPCDSAGAPCSVDNLPAGATTAVCQQSFEPGDVRPSRCVAE